MVVFFGQMDLAVFLYRLPIPRVIAVQILQQEVGGIIIGAAILCLGKCLAFGIRHAAQPAIDTLAEHLCQITGCVAGVANIVVIVVKQLGAHDIPHVIGAVAVLPFFRQRFLHILSDIPNRCLRINRLSVSTEPCLDKVRTNIATIKRLHRTAVQGRLRGLYRGRCIIPLSVLRHLCSGDIHSLKMGGRRGVQQGIPLGVTVVIGCKIFLLDGNRLTVAIIRNTVTILRAIGNSAKGGIICCVLICQNSELTIAKVQVLVLANCQNTRNRPI